MKISVLINILCINMFLVSCGNSTAKQPIYLKTKVTSIIPNKLTTVFENTKSTLTINVKADGEYKTEWQLVSGTPIYFQKKSNNSLSFIAPNVETDQIVAIKATVKGSPQTTKEFTWTFTVKNKELKPLINKPKPNVFSSANLDKHKNTKKDAVGIPLLTVKGIDYYYPVSIAAYSYDLYNSYYKTDSNEVLTKFITNATWLRDNCIYTQYGFCSFRAHFPITDYKSY